MPAKRLVLDGESLILESAINKGRSSQKIAFVSRAQNL